MQDNESNKAERESSGEASGASSNQEASGASTGRRTYVVKTGDTLSKIAKEFYGDANRYMDIFNANTHKLTDPNKIKPGQELIIP